MGEHAVARDRSGHGRRPRRGRRRQRDRSEALLHRICGRRRVEERERHADLGSGIRQAAGGRDRRGHDRSEQQRRRLGRDGREQSPQRRQLRRRRLQDDRRRRHVDQHGSEKLAFHIADSRGSPQFESRHRRGARRRVRRQLGPRRLRDRGRRQDLEADALRRPDERRVGSGDGRSQPERRLRGHLAVPPQAVDVPERRRPGRSLQVHRRRRNVAAHRGPRFSRRRDGPHRLGRRSDRRQPRLCAGRVEGRHPLA